MITPQDQIASIVSVNGALAAVFQRYGIDCGLEAELELAGREAGVSPEFLSDLLNMFDMPGYLPRKQLYRHPVPVILDYLHRTHEYYFSRRLPAIEQVIHHLITRYGSQVPALLALAGQFRQVRDLLYEHVQLEESRLFPYLRQLISLYEGGLRHKSGVARELNWSVEIFISCHDEEAENRLAALHRHAREGFTALQSESAFRLFLLQMRAFEADLRIHAFIEDEVLIPKCLAMERILRDSPVLRAGMN